MLTMSEYDPERQREIQLQTETPTFTWLHESVYMHTRYLSSYYNKWRSMQYSQGWLRITVNHLKYTSDFGLLNCILKFISCID